MSYPIEILPNSKYKRIEGNLSGHFLLRYTKTNDPNDLWDSNFNQIKDSIVCHPRENILDLSTSLLGVYNENHVTIELTKVGLQEYDIECEPNENVDCPTYDVHYFFNENKGFWVISIDSVLNTIVDYSAHENNIRFIATCFVIHTPRKWNYWHFSFRWQLDSGEIVETIDDAKRKKKLARLIGSEARAMLAKNAKIRIPAHKVLEAQNYLKEDLE